VPIEVGTLLSDDQAGAVPVGSELSRELRDGDALTVDVDPVRDDYALAGNDVADTPS
jgi:hypothetical protein